MHNNWRVEMKEKHFDCHETWEEATANMPEGIDEDQWKVACGHWMTSQARVNRHLDIIWKLVADYACCPEVSAFNHKLLETMFGGNLVREAGSMQLVTKGNGKWPWNKQHTCPM